MVPSAKLARAGWALCAFGSAPFISGEALAQAAPGRIAPETLRPQTPQTGTDIVLPEVQFGAVPAGAADLSVTVSSIVVDGGTPEFQPAIDEATATVVGKQVTIAELYAVASRIEAAYARAGHVLVRVTVPPQRIRDGEAFRIMIVDGFIEAVDVSAIPARAREAVRRRAATLIGARGLTLSKIERHVLLAGQVPGVTLRSTLVRGEAVGATRLVLNAEWKPLALTVSAENNIGSAFGNLAFSAQLSLNNVFGQGEQVYAQATTGRDLGTLFQPFPNRRVVGVGAVVPLGANGLTFNPEYTVVDTNPMVPARALTTTGKFKRVALRLQYPLVHSRSQTIDLTGGLDLVSELSVASQFGGALSRDRLRIANFGIKWSGRVGSNSGFASDLQFSQGLAGLGARTQADARASGTPLSRQGSQPDFSRLSVRLRLDRQLGAGFTATGIVRGQTSLSGALPTAGQFSLDGGEGLSGLSQGSVNVDTGMATRAELSRAVAIGKKAPLVVTPYGFAAYATGRLSQPTVAEARSREGWSAGGGARVLLNPGFGGVIGYGAVEVSRNHVSTVPRDTTRVVASLSFRV